MTSPFPADADTPGRIAPMAIPLEILPPASVGTIVDVRLRKPNIMRTKSVREKDATATMTEVRGDLLPGDAPLLLPIPDLADPFPFMLRFVWQKIWTPPADSVVRYCVC